MHGYMLPCGCSKPQYGGLVRRHVFINQLKAKGWPVAAIDLGELGPTKGIKEQRELKFQYSMKALDLMGYDAIGMGNSEMLMPLTDALSLYSLQQKVAHPRPLVSSVDDQKRWYHGLGARRFEIFGAGTPGTPRVGVLSLTGPHLADSLVKADRSLKFLDNSKQVFPQAQQAFAKAKVDMAVIMHHEYAKDAATGDIAGILKMETLRREKAELCALSWAAARKKNPAIPPLQLLMVLTEQSEPPSMLRRVPKTPTYILEIGHKGKYVGVVGVFRNNGGYDLQYELVLMEPKLDPAPGQKDAIIDVLEEYTRQVKAQDMLRKYIRSPHSLQVDPYVVKKYGGTRFAGSDVCAGCHFQEAAIHAKTRHAKAFASLENAKRPSLRQFDPECVVCHTTGFKHPEGYNDLPREVKQSLQEQKAPRDAIQKRLAKHNLELAHVGCESCHGPGLAHANHPKDKKLRELMNPFRPSKKEKDLVDTMQTNPNPIVRQEAAQAAKALFDRRMDRIDDFCMKCHDEENNVNRGRPFLQKWTQGTSPSSTIGRATSATSGCRRAMVPRMPPCRARRSNVPIALLAKGPPFHYE